QLFFALVPESEREHPVEGKWAGHPFVLVQMQDNFGIRSRRKTMPALLQDLLPMTVIVNFPVKRDPDGLVLVVHRLPAVGGEVDDAEPAVSQTDAAVRTDPRSRVVRTAMGHGVAHPREQLKVHRRSRVAIVVDSEDSAHLKSFQATATVCGAWAD